MEENRRVPNRPQGRQQEGLKVPPTRRQSKEKASIHQASAGLRMPGSGETVERKVQQRRTEEERRTRMEIQRRSQAEEANIEDDKEMKKQAGSSSKARTRKQKQKRLWVFLGSEVIILFVLLIAYVIHYANSKMDQMDYNEIDAEDLGINEGLEISSEKYTTIALFGIDARDVTTNAGNRSDTIMIASINNETKEVKLVSVYRDSYLELSNSDGNWDGAFTKVTHAYAYGGPKAAVATLNKNLDLQITEYVTVNFASLSEVVDDLGGITVNVDDSELYEINRIIPETAVITGKNFTPLSVTGDVTLDGLQATTYCRIRYNVSGGDIGRTERQQEVIRAILKKAKQSDLSTLNKIMDDVSTNVSTSLSKKELLALMSGIFDYELGESQGFPFVYHMDMEYDQTMDRELSVDVPANLKNNVILLHEFLYDMVSEDSTGIAGNNTGETGQGTDAPQTPSTEADAEKTYTPSAEVLRISDEIEKNTGVFSPEDPEFRGAF